jgi:hypothetical protein
MPRRRARPVHAETVTVKRHCDDGTFANKSERDNNCGAPRKRAPADPFQPQPGDKSDGACYRTKGEAMRAFVSRNRSLIEDAGGLHASMTGGELDSVNDKYDLRGKRKVSTFAQALSVAQDGSRCLTDLDLDALNETAVCHDECVLPDGAADAKYLRQEREPDPVVDDEPPFTLFGLRRHRR